MQQIHKYFPDLSKDQYDQLNALGQLYAEWNEKINLTAITDDEGIAMKHFIDSLTIASFIDREQEKKGSEPVSLIDVGTGAGFPGIPLKINKRDLDITLLDSLAKRLKLRISALFTPEQKLREAIRSTGSSSILLLPGLWQTCRCCVSTVCLS